MATEEVCGPFLGKEQHQQKMVSKKRGNEEVEGDGDDGGEEEVDLREKRKNRRSVEKKVLQKVATVVDRMGPRASSMKSRVGDLVNQESPPLPQPPTTSHNLPQLPTTYHHCYHNLPQPPTTTPLTTTSIPLTTSTRIAISTY